MIVAIIFLGIPAFLLLAFALWVLYHNVFHYAGSPTTMILGPFVVGILLAILCYLTITDSGSSSTTKNEKIICQACDREFQKGSENAKSIRKTNMCTQCYQNFKNASDYLKELPVN